MKSPQDTTILVVDDEEMLREVIASAFRRRGYRVRTAPSGNAAFDSVVREPVDVVVTDVRMPDGSGVDLLRNLKELDVRLPVIIFVTAYSDLPVERAYDMGVEAVLSKPFDAKVLMAKVERALQALEERLAGELGDASTDTVLAQVFDTPENAAVRQSLRVGRGGAFVALRGECPAIEEAVTLDMRFSGVPEAVLHARAIVRWRRPEAGEGGPAGVGVEFIALAEASRAYWLPRLAASRDRAYIPLA